MGQQFRSLSFSFTENVISVSRKTRENVSVCANDGRVNSIAIPPFPLSALPFRFRLYFPTIRATRVYFPWKRAIRERERERESKESVGFNEATRSDSIPYACVSFHRSRLKGNATSFPDPFHPNRIRERYRSFRCYVIKMCE